MDRERCGGVWAVLQVPGKEVEDVDGVDVGFKLVTDNVVKSRRLGVHNHDREGDASASEFDPFIDVGNGEIVDVVILKRGSNGEEACTVGVGLDHRHEAGSGSEQVTIVVEIVYKRINIDLEECLMAFLPQSGGDALKVEGTGSFEEDSFVVECVGLELQKELFGGRVEGGFCLREKRLLSEQGGSDGYQTVDMTRLKERGELGI